jgi:membrane protein implicated in regulation of membrane protease activity
MSPANFSTLMVFLAWFGGAGFFLARTLRQPAWIALPAAAVAGVLGAYVVYLFVARVLMARDHTMRALDYSLPGTLAAVTLSIRSGGTGEITYVQGGTRRSAAARCDDPGAIANGVEVIVIRFEEGIAYVRRFPTDARSMNEGRAPPASG